MLAVARDKPEATSRVLYEQDTHFSLTYVLMRLACFSHKDALIIASADQSVDDCSNTDPGFNSAHNPKWHSLNDTREQVTARKNELWQRAVASKDLVKLGQYFHYQEDWWGHRQGHGVGDDWQPYGPTFGHAKDGHQPDRPPYDRARAREMAKEKLSQAQEFNRMLGGTPMDVPADMIGFLIDYQCIAYTHDAFGLWNEVNPDDVAKLLDNVCQKYFAEGKIKKHIHTPLVSEKLRYEYDDDGNVTNADEIKRALERIEDYNFAETPPAQPQAPTQTPAVDKPAVNTPPIVPANPAENPPAAVPQGPAENPTGGAPQNPPAENPSPKAAPQTPPAENQGGLQSEVSATFEVVETEQMVPAFTEWCYSTCLGGKHQSHDACDKSCDATCRMRHGGKLTGYHTVDFYSVASALPNLDKQDWFMRQSGNALTQLEHLIDAEVQPYDDKVGTLPSDHFAPLCSAAMRQWGFKKLQLKMHSKIRTYGEIDGKLVNEVKSFDGPIGYVYVPDTDKPMSAKVEVSCACEPNGYRSMLPPTNRTPTELTPADGPQAVRAPAGYGLFQLPKFTFNGIDMNNLDVQEVEDGWEVYFPGGYVYYCDDPDCQGEVTLYGTYGTFGKPLGIGIGGGGGGGPRVADPFHVTIPAACIDIDKKAPHPGVTFHPAPVQDPVLRKLAILAEWESLRGPWDQARIWIYRSNASLERINQRMIPGVAPGQYVKCLFDVAKAANLDPRQDPFKSLLEPKFVFDPFGSRDATLWFIKTLAAVDPSGLAAAIHQGAPAWGAALQDNDRDYPHAVDLLDGLNQSMSPDVQRAMADVMAALPAAARDRILNKTMFGKAMAAFQAESKK